MTIYNDENGKVVRDEAILSLKDYDVISEITRNHPVSDRQWKCTVACKILPLAFPQRGAQVPNPTLLQPTPSSGGNRFQKCRASNGNGSQME